MTYFTAYQLYDNWALESKIVQVYNSNLDLTCILKHHCQNFSSEHRNEGKILVSKKYLTRKLPIKEFCNHKQHGEVHDNDLQNMFFVKKQKFAFCLVGKVGSSTWIEHLLAMVGQNKSVLVKVSRFHWVIQFACSWHVENAGHIVLCAFTDTQCIKIDCILSILTRKSHGDWVTPRHCN